MTNATKVVHQQETIFQLLKTYANDRGYVKGLDIDSINRLTGVTHHDVTKTLWGLQKRGLIGFSEKKGTAGHSIPFRFRIRKAGLDADQEEVRQAEPIQPPQESEAEVKESFEADDLGVISQLINREKGLRTAAELLDTIGLESLAISVLENVRLKDDELRILRQFFEQ